MASITFTVTEAVTEICEAMDDGDFLRWGEDTDYTGRALDKFIESINDLIALYSNYVEARNLGLNPDPIPYSERDFYGIIGRNEVEIASNSAIDVSANIDDVYRVLEVYPDPAGTNHVQKVFTFTTEASLRGLGGQYFLDDDEVEYYYSGDNIHFITASATYFASSATFNVYVKTIEYCSIDKDGADKDTDLLGIYTKPLIDAAIKLTVEKLMLEEQRTP